MKIKGWAIALVLFCTLLMSIGQLLYKKGANLLEFNLMAIITNYQLILGYGIYILAAILLIIALRYGELSVLYPITATSYIWIALLSMFFLSEVIGVYKWVGIILIIFGISFIGFGGKNG